MTSTHTLAARRLRASMSATEALVWTRLRGRQIDGWKFRRQHPFGPYFVDFYCPAARLVVEVNGPAHSDEQAAYDERRLAFLESLGNRVVQIPVSDIDRDIGEVIDTIANELTERRKLGSTGRPHPPAAPGTSPQAGKTDRALPTFPADI